VKYAISTDIDEIKEVLKKSKTSSESIVWQTSSNTRNIFKIQETFVDSLRKILKFKLKGDVHKIDPEVVIYTKLSFRNTIFKGNLIGQRDGYLFVSIPEEVQLEELREIPRFSFTTSEDKFATLAMRSDLIDGSMFNLKLKLSDINTKGMGLIVSYANAETLKNNDLYLSELGKHSFSEKIEAKIMYDKHFSYREDGKNIKCMKMGVRLSEIMSQNTLETFVRSAEGFDHSVIGFLGHSFEFENSLHSQMDNMYSILNKNNNLFNSLNQFSKSPLTRKEDEYFPKHIKLVARISCGIAKLIGHDTKKVMESLIYCAFVHDIAFIANRKLALIQDKFHFNQVKETLTNEERELFIHAPRHAFDFAFYDKYSPKGVEKIMIQLRELPDGSGHPNKLLAPDIHPIAAIFIVAHDITDYMLDRISWNFQEYLAHYRNKFSGGIFEEIGDILDSARTSV
jgi:HD-GYP domain-containing protein (c-di-GMP phosphodiesterase class II)